MSNSIQIQAPDGYMVTYNPDERGMVWFLEDLYMGTTGYRKYVGKVGDLVIVDRQTDTKKIITALNMQTLIPTLEPLGGNGGGLFTDALSQNPDTFRVLLDKNVYPYAMSVDRRFLAGGDDMRYARIFKGTDTSNDANIVSQLFDSSGTYLDNKVALELALYDSHENVSTKTVPTCYTYEDFKNGDVVTVVFYNDEGHEVASKAMWVVLSSWVPAQNVEQRYIDSVSLQTPFLSESDPKLVEMPINTPITSFNMFGVLHYSDGSQSDPMPVNNGKLSLHGLGRFVGVYPGQKSDLVLSYALSSDEPSYSGTKSADGKFISATYQMVTVQQRGAFSTKLVGYPEWRNDLGEFRMRWFMSDLDRETMFDVTPYVYYNLSSDNFNGTAYNKIQNLSVRINLKDVSISFPSYNHTQTMSVVLNNAGTQPGPNWKVAFDPNQQPWFGERLVAQVVMTNQNLWRVSLRNAQANVADWLDRVFFDSKPVYDKTSEERAPTPTHFNIIKGNFSMEVPVDAWNQEFNVALNLGSESNLYMEFIRRTDAGDLRLGVVGIPIKQA